MSPEYLRTFETVYKVITHLNALTGGVTPLGDPWTAEELTKEALMMVGAYASHVEKQQFHEWCEKVFAKEYWRHRRAQVRRDKELRLGPHPPDEMSVVRFRQSHPRK